ncbi:TIR domain-containing protein [Spongiactinospora sp. TRM90649]|uniref:TIR domain-containing protein n=1 Tax=Spongiactinospora sp. TRM90649 TaxID=3031114 RepID=UPI0023F661AB|nr:TIR domain-containing protein [Spongiactinospora sp. TRM90649]MDF5754525.1 TIR domain-containing protein [Spongiactinospora sp. TRM90649]
MSKLFICYARQDASWARELAERLTDHGIEIFFDEWSLLPGDVVVHQVEEAIRKAADGIAIFGPGSARDGRALAECAALMRAAAEDGLRFIPVLYGGATIPRFAAGWIWRDFGHARDAALTALVAELAAEVTGEATGASLGTREEMAMPAPPRPLTPAERSVVVCYAPADAAYGRALTGRIGAAGLPVWSVRSLRPGEPHVWTIRARLRHATVIVVVMTPQAQDSDDVTRMILEGQWHGRPFFPILLRGERHYQLANLSYLDARAGGRPGDEDVATLRRLHEAALEDRPVSVADVLPPPLSEPAVRSAVRVPASVSLGRLRDSLAAGEVEHADLLTTSALLEAAGRLGAGWLRRADGERLTDPLLAGIDALWAAFSGGALGFRAQLGAAGIRSARHAEFLSLSVRLGWRRSPDETVPVYREFAGRGQWEGQARPGFFPTLRNPQSERYLDWYDQWTQTVLTVHGRLKEWGER